MFMCDLMNAIFVPSGDHVGWLQPRASGSAFAPPHADAGWTLISCRPLPSACTTQIELCTSGVTCWEKTISFPCGDQLPKELKSRPAGVICFSPVPLVLTTNKASTVVLRKTIRFPFGDQSLGMSSPLGTEVTGVRPPPSDERIVWMPFWLPSSLNVSQRSSVPSGDGIPQGLKSVGSCPSMMREVPSSGLMIHEPPLGSGQQVAMWAPSENHRGNSPVSVGPCMSRSPVPSGLTTYAWVSSSGGLNRANVSWPFVPGGLAPAGSAATATNATARSATR